MKATLIGVEEVSGNSCLSIFESGGERSMGACDWRQGEEIR